MVDTCFVIYLVGYRGQLRSAEVRALKYYHCNLIGQLNSNQVILNVCVKRTLGLFDLNNVNFNRDINQMIFFVKNH